MTPDDFVVRLRASIVEENAAIYRQLFTDTTLDRAPDPYWQRALSLFNDLSGEQQNIFLEVVRQVAADTVSNVLGVIDGVNTLDGLDEQFVLTCGSGIKLSGDLQSRFLVEEERYPHNLG